MDINIRHFCTENSKHWEEKSTKTKEMVLVEGFFAEAGPNYVMRVGMFAKILEDKFNLAPLVLLRHGIQTENVKRDIWKSFNINNFIGLSEDLQLSFRKRCQVNLLALFYQRKMQDFLNQGKYKQFRSTSYKGIEFGDLLYDDIIKTNSENFTVKKISKKNLKAVFQTIFQMDMLLEKYKIKFFITTHAQYIAYGLFARYALANDIPTIETTDDIQFYYKATDRAKYHCYVGDYIKNQLNSIINEPKLIENARSALDKRFTGSIEQLDVVLAFRNKEIYTKETFKEKLGIINDNPCVFIFAHIFTDAPSCLTDFQLYPDHYTWLDKTVEFCATQKHINWIIKEHPSVAAYPEHGEVAKLVARHQDDTTTIYLCPDDFSTSSTKELAHTIITAQGTVGIEFACYGTPILLSAKPFYADFGFTIEPQTIKEYQSILANIQDLKPLTEIQKKTALAVYAGLNLLLNKDHTLIDTQIKALVWGLNADIDSSHAFELMAQRLKEVDPKQSSFYKEAEKNIASTYNNL